MSSLYAIFASLTLALPFAGHFAAAEVDTQKNIGQGLSSPVAPMCHAPDDTAQTSLPTAQHSGTQSKGVLGTQSDALPLSSSNSLDAIYNSATANQVRIKRSVTVRITPFRQSSRNSLLAQLPRRGVRAYEEREMADCVPVSGIAGVQTATGNRLLLFLRDQRIISLNLERGCEARDFYSGFYVERNEDGRLCVKRDQLQSRSGAKCEVAGMTRLVRAGN